MARFLLLLSPERRNATHSAAELGRRTSDFVAWVSTLRRSGVLRAGARLGNDSRRIARDREGVRVSGGSQANAQVGLYFVIESPDWSSALEHAASCPVADPGMIDVFELDLAAELGPELRTSP